MNNIEEQRTAERYGKLFEAHGDSYRTLDWGSQAGQSLRFQILADIGDLQGKRILDVGCGLGDFAGWLHENKIEVDYTGLELTPELVTKARNSYPELNFIQGSIQDRTLLAGQSFDFVFASGIFSTYCANGRSWLEDTVSRMWELCSGGLAFNSLSVWTEQRDEGEFYADPVATLQFCRTLTSWVTLRCDYHPRDFAMYLSRIARK